MTIVCFAFPIHLLLHCVVDIKLNNVLITVNFQIKGVHK